MISGHWGLVKCENSQQIYRNLMNFVWLTYWLRWRTASYRRAEWKIVFNKSAFCSEVRNRIRVYLYQHKRIRFAAYEQLNPSRWSATRYMEDVKNASWREDREGGFCLNFVVQHICFIGRPRRRNIRHVKCRCARSIAQTGNFEWKLYQMEKQLFPSYCFIHNDKSNAVINTIQLRIMTSSTFHFNDFQFIKCTCSRCAAHIYPSNPIS